MGLLRGFPAMTRLTAPGIFACTHPGANRAAWQRSRLI